MKRNKILFSMALLLLLMNMACDISSSNQELLTGSESTVGHSVSFDMRHGRESIVSNPQQLINLNSEYEKWKSNFVVDAVGSVGKRVQRGSGNSYDTVSEGIAYGMLLAYYFDDQETFDDLWTYAKDHTISSDSLLMHWRIDPNGIDISEYSEPIPHGQVFAKRLDLMDDLAGNIIPGDTKSEINFLNTLNYENTLDTSYYYTANEIHGMAGMSTGEPNSSEFKLTDSGEEIFISLNRWPRETSSASDADFDIGAALCFAAETWSGGDHDYVKDAAKVISDILKHDITDTGFIKNGHKWGSEETWNPSYFAPAWFRVFARFATKHPSEFDAPMEIAVSFYSVIDNVYEHMDYIDNYNYDGYFPDWCDTSSGAVKPADGSDRRYYFYKSEIVGYETVDMHGKVTIYPPTNAYHHGQSFNYFYDAIRTIWRMGVDYSWYNDECDNTESYLQEMSNAMPALPSKINDGSGISWDTGLGTQPWKWSWGYRDMFNTHHGGKSESLAFVSMMACSKMATNDNAQEYYNYIINKWEDPNLIPLAYYPNTLRLLSLLYISGYMENPYDLYPKPQLTSPSSPPAEGSTKENPVHINQYDWNQVVDLSRGYAWVEMDLNQYPSGAGWQIHHVNDIQFNVQIQDENGNPAENTGTQWSYMVQQNKLNNLVKITYVSGADQIMIQCW